MMEVNNIGHLSAPADRPFSEGWGRERKAEYVRRMVAELCHEFGLSDRDFRKAKRQAAITVRQRVSRASYDLLRPEWSILEIADLVGLPYTTMFAAAKGWCNAEGAEIDE